MKLNLGACDRAFPGYVSVDRVPPADVVTDLRDPWPWPESSIEEVLAYSVFEHLPDKRHTLNELWRVLKPGARATLLLPVASEGDGGFCDPTHCSYWTRSDFEYFTAGDPNRERFDRYSEVVARFRVCNLEASGAIPIKRYARRYGGTVVEMTVVLEAVK